MLKNFFFGSVALEVLVPHSHQQAPANEKGEWTKSSPGSFAVAAVPFTGRALPRTEPAA